MSESVVRRPVVLIVCFVIAAIALVISAMLMSRLMLQVQNRSENIVTVKGVAERKIISDLGSFTCTVAVNANSLKEGYPALEAVLNRLIRELGRRGFRADELREQRISYYSVTRTERTVVNGQTNSREVFSHYRFNGSVRIMSNRVELIEQEAQRLYALLADGVDIEITRPQYFITDLEQYKQDLVDKATISAQQRAAAIAGRTGGSIKRLVRGRQGVIQITRPASNDDSDYGVFDTSTVEKNMRMVVTLEFEVE